MNSQDKGNEVSTYHPGIAAAFIALYLFNPHALELYP